MHSQSKSQEASDVCDTICTTVIIIVTKLTQTFKYQFTSTLYFLSVAAKLSD